MLDEELLRSAEKYRKWFDAECPMPQLVVVPNFLRLDLARTLLSDARSAEVDTFSAWVDPARTGKIKSGFEPLCEKRTYVTIHQRCLHQLPLFERVREQFNGQRELRWLSHISGQNISTVGCNAVLSFWGADSFIEPHTDSASCCGGFPVKLVVSLSLTESWNASWGGLATYQWQNKKRLFHFHPRFNSAVIFKPTGQSRHWVDRVLAIAGNQRITWTIHFH